MKNSEVKFKIFVLCLLMVPCFLYPVDAKAGELLTVSIKNLSTIQNERVLAFKITIKSAGVHSLPVIPIGWGIAIDNDPSWNTSVSGNISVGAAALNANFFKDFIVLEKGPDETPIEVTIEMTTRTNRNIDNEKTVTFTTKDLLFKKMDSH